MLAWKAGILAVVAVLGSLQSGRGTFVRTIAATSMWPTYNEGDRVRFQRHFELEDLERGDVIAFQHIMPDGFEYRGLSEARRTFYMYKRLLGLPGDTVEILTDGNVLLNGEALPQTFVRGDVYIETRFNNREHPAQILSECVAVDVCYEIARFEAPIYSHHEQNAVLTLGPGEYFVLGDNRDNSNDSRNITGYGLVLASEIRGRVPIR